VSIRAAGLVLYSAFRAAESPLMIALFHCSRAAKGALDAPGIAVPQERLLLAHAPHRGARLPGGLRLLLQVRVRGQPI